MSVSISDRALSITVLTADKEKLYAEAKAISDEMYALLESTKQARIEMSNRQKAIIEKIAALDDSTQAIVMAEPKLRLPACCKFFSIH